VPRFPRPTPAALLDRNARVPDHVVWRAFDAETLLLNLQTGQYHGLNSTGSRTLELVAEGDNSVREAIWRLAEEYAAAADEIEADLLDFLADLVERGLIELDDDAPGPLAS
jgi:coenzyme PQQ synthesis protein D (PqqD)